jgi:hypothetical protein
MSPSDIRSRKTAAPNNIYTAFLAVSFGILAASALFVTFKCLSQYDTLFTIP